MTALIVVLAIVVFGLLLAGLGIGLSRRAQRRTREISEQLGIPVERPPRAEPEARGQGTVAPPARPAPPVRPRPGRPPARPEGAPAPPVPEAPPGEPSVTIPEAPPAPPAPPAGAPSTTRSGTSWRRACCWPTSACRPPRGSSRSCASARRR